LGLVVLATPVCITPKDYRVAQNWIYQLWRTQQVSREECVGLLERYSPFVRRGTEDLTSSHIIRINAGWLSSDQ